MARPIEVYAVTTMIVAAIMAVVHLIEIIEPARRGEVPAMITLNLAAWIGVAIFGLASAIGTWPDEPKDDQADAQP